MYWRCIDDVLAMSLRCWQRHRHYIGDSITDNRVNRNTNGGSGRDKWWIELKRNLRCSMSELRNLRCSMSELRNLRCSMSELRNLRCSMSVKRNLRFSISNTGLYLCRRAALHNKGTALQMIRRIGGGGYIHVLFDLALISGWSRSGFALGPRTRRVLQGLAVARNE
jgi:hypothetical protein